MIYFYATLIETAMKIINAESMHGDINACIDIGSAQTAINTYNQFNQTQAQTTDARLRREYLEIEMLQTAIDNFPRTQVPFITQASPEPEIITRLKFDINGILLSVLISHNVIGQAKDFIEKID